MSIKFSWILSFAFSVFHFYGKLIDKDYIVIESHLQNLPGAAALRFIQHSWSSYQRSRHNSIKTLAKNQRVHCLLWILNWNASWASAYENKKKYSVGTKTQTCVNMTPTASYLCNSIPGKNSKNKRVVRKLHRALTVIFDANKAFPIYQPIWIVRG